MTHNYIGVSNMFFRTGLFILLMFYLLIPLDFPAKSAEKNPFGITLKSESLSEENFRKVIEELHTGWYRPAPV